MTVWDTNQAPKVQFASRGSTVAAQTVSLPLPTSLSLFDNVSKVNQISQHGHLFFYLFILVFK